MQKTLSVISLKNIRENLALVRKMIGSKKLYAVVKADAYGHGSQRVSAEIENLVDGFCVAIVDEGVALRVSGIVKPILVFCPPLQRDDIIKARFYNLAITVNSVETAKQSLGLDVHIKVNTGTNRSGCNLSDVEHVIRATKGRFVGIYSHLYAAESERESLKQLELFKGAVAISKRYNSEVISHISASGGILRGGDFLLDGVRCGLLMYGYVPTGFKDVGFLPALKVYAKRQQTTKFIGGGVGYNRSEREYESLSTYRLGYGDGFFRTVPLGEGNLCMDAFMSTKNEDTLLVMDDAERYARRANTISYEVLTSVTRRSEKIYER